MIIVKSISRFVRNTVDSLVTIRKLKEHGAKCYFEKEGILISGDTLFEGSVGRTDFPTGSGAVLSRSLKEKLMCLPEEVKVYPGHGGFTTIGEEKRYNPFCA